MNMYKKFECEGIEVGEHNPPIRFGRIEIHFDLCKVKMLPKNTQAVGGKSQYIRLSPTAFAVIGALIKAQGRPLSTKMLYQAAWPALKQTDNEKKIHQNVQTHIHLVRKKIGQDMIITHQGNMYSLAKL